MTSIWVVGVASVHTSFPRAWLSAWVTFGQEGHSQSPLHIWAFRHETRFAKVDFLCGEQDFQPPPGAATSTTGSSNAAPAAQQPTPVPTRSLQLRAARLQVHLCTSKVMIWRQDHIFVPKIIFISPSFVHTNYHNNTVLPEHHLPTAAKP